MSAQSSDQDTASIIEANTRFAVKLFKNLTAKSAEHNILVAPTGLSLTFGLLDNGCVPSAREEIEPAFEFKGMDLAQINNGLGTLRKEFKMNFATPPGPESARHHPPVRNADYNGILVADSLWARSNYFSASFLKLSREYYGVELKPWLASPSIDVQVSRWASKKAGTAVPIRMGAISHNDFLFVDVTRFHSLWTDQFSSDKTKPTPFHLLSGQTKNVPMMYKQEYFSYFEGPKFQAVALSYRESAGMYVFLPSEDSSLKELEQSLSAETWQDWISQFHSREGMLGLPKFKAETGFDVRAALEDLGVKSVFENYALRSAVTIPEGARLTNALQKTELTVDEKGTQAISVGLMGGVPGGIMGAAIGPERPKPFVMIVNRPFLFVIRHSSGQILFLGAVVDP